MASPDTDGLDSASQRNVAAEQKRLLTALHRYITAHYDATLAPERFSSILLRIPTIRVRSFLFYNGVSLAEGGGEEERVPADHRYVQPLRPELPRQGDSARHSSALCRRPGRRLLHVPSIVATESLTACAYHNVRSRTLMFIDSLFRAVLVLPSLPCCIEENEIYRHNEASSSLN